MEEPSPQPAHRPPREGAGSEFPLRLGSAWQPRGTTLVAFRGVVPGAERGERSRERHGGGASGFGLGRAGRSSCPAERLPALVPGQLHGQGVTCQPDGKRHVSRDYVRSILLCLVLETEQKHVVTCRAIKKSGLCFILSHKIKESESLLAGH